MADKAEFPLPEAQDAYQEMLLGILSRLPGSLAGSIQLCAVPHWFDEVLLGRLTGNPTGASQMLEEMARMRFIERDPSGRFTIQPGVRAILLDDLRKQEPERYLAANQAALDFFQKLLDRAPIEEVAASRRQVIYHQMIVDESAGLKLLVASFEDAYDRRQLGAAEDYLTLVSELKSTLSEDGRAWLEYFYARLDLAAVRDPFGAAVFTDLALHAADSFLRALALWNLGQIDLMQHRWTQAINRLQNAQTASQGQLSGLYAGRVELTLGDAYLDLAQKSGGIQTENGPSEGGLVHFLEFLIIFPSLFIAWFLRQASWLPDGWYVVGTNYQDWIIYYLLDQASRWYRRASRQFEQKHDPHGLVEAMLPLAKIELLKRRWSRAEKNYRALLQKAPVTASPYRTARVLLGQAELLNQRGQAEEAAQAARLAQDAFERFRSHSLAGEAAGQLGQADYQLRHLDRAAQAYLTSLKAFQQAGELLKGTTIVWELERLAKEAGLSADIRQQVVEAIEEVTQRAYLARFTDRLLHWFRRIALWGALPFTYLIVLEAGFLLFLGTTLIEEWVTQIFAINNVSSNQPSILIPLLVFTLLPIPLSFWIYRFVYSVTGLTVVHGLGRRLVAIERSQPLSIITLPGELVLRSQAPENIRTWAWDEILQLAEVNYRIWKRPIQLISRLVLRTPKDLIVLDESTHGYVHLQEDIARHLGREVPRHYLDFTFLGSPWTLVALLISIGYAFFATTYDWVVTINQRLLHFAPIFFYSFLSMQFVYTSVTLWRLAFFRLKCRKVIRARYDTWPDWLIWLLALISTLLAAGLLLLFALIQ